MFVTLLAYIIYNVRARETQNLPCKNRKSGLFLAEISINAKKNPFCNTILTSL